MEKTCNRCEEVKDLNDFHKRTASADGHDAICKECRKSRVSKKPIKLSDAIKDDDRAGAEKVLRALGYELYNEDYPVHQQFMERMATKDKLK